MILLNSERYCMKLYNALYCLCVKFVYEVSWEVQQWKD